MKKIVRYEASITRYRALVIAYFRQSFEGSDQFVFTTSYFYDVNEVADERIKHRIYVRSHCQKFRFI